jgi:hypothetical protein
MMRASGTKLAAAAMAGVLAGTAFTAAAHADPTLPCGYYHTSTSTYFRNCSAISVALVHVDTILNVDRTICVGKKANEYLGTILEVRGATRLGDC